MGRFDAPPFARGESYFNGGWIDTSQMNNLGGLDYEGREYEMEDELHGTGATIRVRVVRNLSATPVKASQLVLPAAVDFNATPEPGNFLGQVNGVTTANAQICYVADELLPPNGIPQYDLFYCVVEGPCLVQNPATGASVLAIGERVVSNAGGTIVAAAYTGTGAALAANILNDIGIVIGNIPVAGSEANALILVDIEEMGD